VLCVDVRKLAFEQLARVAAKKMCCHRRRCSCRHPLLLPLLNSRCKAFAGFDCQTPRPRSCCIARLILRVTFYHYSAALGSRWDLESVASPLWLLRQMAGRRSGGATRVCSGTWQDFARAGAKRRFSTGTGGRRPKETCHSRDILTTCSFKCAHVQTFNVTGQDFYVLYQERRARSRPSER
jgi:hypothetical protein